MLSDYTDWRELVDKPNELVLPADLSQSPVFLIVDDHDAILQCLVPLLKKTYPEALLWASRDYQSAIALIEKYPLSLAILDLELPDQLGETVRNGAGLALLELAMKKSGISSILAIGENIKPLRRLKSEIYDYTTGFAAVDKAQPVATVLKLLELALAGSIHLPLAVRTQPELSDKWATVLRLKYQEGFSDSAIAQRLSVSSRTIRSYWPSIQDQLGVYDDPSKDIRVQIEQAARQAGLIS